MRLLFIVLGWLTLATTIFAAGSSLDKHTVYKIEGFPLLEFDRIEDQAGIVADDKLIGSQLFQANNTNTIVGIRAYLESYVDDTEYEGSFSIGVWKDDLPTTFTLSADEGLILPIDLAVIYGGTGASSFNDGGIILGNGTSALTSTAQPTDGQILIGRTGLDPVLASITGDAEIVVTGGAGTIDLEIGSGIARHTDSIGDFVDVNLAGIDTGDVLKWDGDSFEPSEDLSGDTADFDTEAEFEALLTDTINVFTDNDTIPEANIHADIARDAEVAAAYQPIDATLTALAAYNTNGIVTQTTADTFTGRSIAVTSNTGLSITNGNGVSGNPTLAGINAAADGSTKGVAAFNATNFSAASGVINTIQNINTTADPTFDDGTFDTLDVYSTGTVPQLQVGLGPTIRMDVSQALSAPHTVTMELTTTGNVDGPSFNLTAGDGSGTGDRDGGSMNFETGLHVGSGSPGAFYFNTPSISTHRVHYNNANSNGSFLWEIEQAGTRRAYYEWNDANDGLTISNQYGQIIFRTGNAGSVTTRMTIDADGTRVGIGMDAATNNLEVSGTASKTASGDWLANSDRRIKENVVPISNATDLLRGLRPVTYEYTDDYLDYANHSIRDQKYFGFIAQEYQKQFPDFVYDSGVSVGENDHILQIDSFPSQVVTTAAVIELIGEIETMKKQIEELRRKVR